MEKAFMEQYFEMAYEDLHKVLMRENDDLKDAQETLQKSVGQLFAACANDPNQLREQLCERFTAELYMAEYLLMKYAYLKGAEDRDRMLK